MAEVFTYPNALPHASRVSITNGESVATFANANVSGYDWSGAQLWIIPDAAQPYLAAIIADAGPDADYEATELDLVFQWNGTTITDAKFLLVGGAAFADPSRTAAGNSRFRNQTQQNMGLVGDVSDVTDYSHVLNNTVLYDGVKRALYRWRSGTLEVLPLSQLGNPKGAWSGEKPKHTLSIVTGDVAVDGDDGPNYELALSADAELQLPSNVEEGDVLDFVITGGGDSNTFAFASGFTGMEAASVNLVDGALTRFRGVVTAETGGTATAVSVSQVTYALNDKVEHEGSLFLSNVADNVDYPRFDGSDPVSNNNWTWVPVEKGEPGSALLTATSNTSVTLEAGTLVFSLAENAERGFGPGSWVIIADSANPTTNYGLAQVSEYDHPSLTVSLAADDVFGSGTISSWVITAASVRGAPGTQPGLAYEFDTTTSAGADPGTMRANNADLSAATHLYFADDDFAGIDQSAFLAQVGDSTSTTKGHVHVKRVADGTQTIFRIDAAASDETGYVDVTVTYVSGSTSIADESLVSVEFKDRGDAGSGASAFTDLDDTPASLSGQGDKIVKVNSAGTALEFGVVLGDAAAKNTGSTAGSVAAGDDPRIDGAIQSSTLTTRGDILVLGASAPTRLAKGSEGALLIAGGDDPAWSKISGFDQELAPASGDLLMIETAEGDVKKVDWNDLPGGGSVPAAAKRSMAKLRMQAAKQAAAVINWIGGISDSFDTAAGLNTGGSTNMSTAEAGVIKPTTSTATNQLPTMTGSTTSGVTIAASSTYSGFDPWKAADKNNATSWTSNGVQVATWEVDFGTSTIIAGYSIKGDGSYLNRLPKDWTFQGWNGSAWVTLDTRTNETGWSATKRSYSFSNSTGYNKYRLNITAGNGGDGYLTIPEIELFDPVATNDMTAVSAAFDLPAEPDLIDAFFIIEKTDAMTPNTDYIFSASIDGGSNYNAGTIDEIGTVGGKTFCQVLGIDVSARTGTSGVWKIETVSRACKIHSVDVGEAA